MRTVKLEEARKVVLEGLSSVQESVGSACDWGHKRLLVFQCIAKITIVLSTKGRMRWKNKDSATELKRFLLLSL